MTAQVKETKEPAKPDVIPIETSLVLEKKRKRKREQKKRRAQRKKDETNEQDELMIEECEMKSMQEQIKIMQDELKELKAMKDDVKELKELKQELEALKQDVLELKDMKEIIEMKEAIDVGESALQHNELVEEKIFDRLNFIESDIRELKQEKRRRSHSF